MPRKLTHAERGRMGAQRRWRGRRVLRMQDFSPEEQAVIQALLDLKRARESVVEAQRAIATPPKAA